MSSCTELADYEWLTMPEAAAVLEQLAGAQEPLHLSVARLRRHYSPGRVHLLLEQVELRQRAAAKFACAERMFFTPTALEQATDGWVAQYKARRFAGCGPVADLCCGIGGDSLALAERGPVTGVDRDPLAICFARANLRAVLPKAGASWQVEEIERFDPVSFSAWHIDPDRRPTGSRTSSIERSSPSLATIERLLAAAPNAAVKLAPAAEAPQTWSHTCELEWISRDRQCRQLVAWHGDLARTPGLRRATVLTLDGGVARSVIGKPEQPLPFVQQFDRFLFDPDPAVLAARLTGELVNEHRLSAISAGIAYLTGPSPIDDPALACFEVHEVLSLDLRQIASHLRDRNIGRLEIKKRGVDHEPEVVREQLKLRGDGEATLFLTKLNGKHVAIVTQRVTSPSCPAPDRLSLSPVL